MRNWKVTLFSVLQLSTLSAASFVVPDGTTETTTQEVTGANETGLIEKGGAIKTVPDSEHAVLMGMGSGQSVTNDGTLLTEGLFSFGVNNQGSENATITNRGTITTSGSDGRGIFFELSPGTAILNEGTIETSNEAAFGVFGSNSAKNSITNSGLISTSGENANAIFIDSSPDSIVTNSGSIKTSSWDAKGIEAVLCDDSQFINSGSITTLGFESYGIFNREGKRCVIDNSGSIITTFDDASGIFDFFSEDVVIRNSGVIEVSGLDAAGIFSTGSNLQIINSGQISSKEGFAIWLQAENPTLTLLPCSRIIGPLTSQNDLLNLNVEKGLNLILTLDETSMDFGKVNIEDPYILEPKMVTVVSPSSFAVQSDAVVDISETLLNALDDPCCRCSNLWAAGFGSTRCRWDDPEKYRYDQGGFLAGFNFCFFGCNSLNFFGGLVHGRGRPDTEGCGLDLNANTYVGGLAYQGQTCVGSFEAKALLGWSRFDQDRNIFYNLAEDGLIQAHSERSGYFTTEELGYRYDCCFGLWCPSVSAKARYAGLFFGDDAETGTEANLAFSSYSIQMINVRALFGAGFSNHRDCYGIDVEPFVGINGRFQLSGLSQKTTLLGEEFDLQIPLNDRIAGVLFGIKGCFWVGCFNIFANLEGLVEGDHGSRFIGVGGIGYTF